MGDTIWVNERLYEVDTVVRPIAFSVPDHKSAYPAAMNLIIVEDITEEGDSVLKLLNKLRKDGV